MFKFFTFPTTNTKATPLKVQDSDPNSRPYILTNPNAADGLAINFKLDPSQVSEQEFEAFQQYIKTQSLFIDVYDAERLLKFGTICVPLDALHRPELQASVQSTREYDVVESLEHAYMDDGFSSLLLRCLAKLHIRLTNVGRKSGSNIVLFPYSV